MANASWSIGLPDGQHRVEAEFGYWSGKATIRVDGRVVSSSRRLMEMAFNRVIEIPITIGSQAAIVSIRPKKALVTGYEFRLDPVTSRPDAPGVQPVPPASRFGPRAIELMAWASFGGAVIGLSRGGQNPSAVLYVFAPALCSWVTRRSSLSTPVMAVVCLAILSAGIVVVAFFGAQLRR